MRLEPPVHPYPGKERELQIWGYRLIKRVWPDEVVFSLPNERTGVESTIGKTNAQKETIYRRTKGRVSLLKAMGMVPGIPDLCFFEKQAWIEVKAGRRQGSKLVPAKLSPKQIEVQQWLISKGYAVYCVWNKRQFKKAWCEIMGVTVPQFEELLSRADQERYIGGEPTPEALGFE